MLNEAGDALGLARATIARQIDDLLRCIPREADALFNEVEQDNAAIIAARPELTATLGGELRLLRSINGIVIREMVARLLP